MLHVAFAFESLVPFGSFFIFHKKTPFRGVFEKERERKNPSLTKYYFVVVVGGVKTVENSKFPAAGGFGRKNFKVSAVKNLGEKVDKCNLSTRGAEK